jgi:hypothetical protein
MPFFGIQSGFYYPRITYTPPGGTQTVIDFGDALELVEPEEHWIGGQNRSESGVTETLLVRIEQMVTLLFNPLELARVRDLRTLWTTMYGRQFALTLDRFATTSPQWEADFNTTFSKAELVDTRFKPVRRDGARTVAAYRLAVTVRQGT